MFNCSQYVNLCQVRLLHNYSLQFLCMQQLHSGEGFWLFFCFHCLHLLVCSLLYYYCNSLHLSKYIFIYIYSWVLKYILPGFRVVAIAVILQAFIGLFKKIANQYVMIAIVFVSAFAYYLKPVTAVILI